MRTNSHSSPQSPSSSVSLRTLLPHTAMKRHVVEHNELCFARRLQTLLLSKPHAPLPSPPRLLQMQAVLPLPSAARSSSPWSSTTLTIPSYLLRCCPTASDLIAWPGRRRSGPAWLAPPHRKSVAAAAASVPRRGVLTMLAHFGSTSDYRPTASCAPPPPLALLATIKG